jgi:hypothetical protein
MMVLVFTDTNAKQLIADQLGQHRISPVQLTDGRWFVSSDILTEVENGLFKDKLTVLYETLSFDEIKDFIETLVDIEG